MNAGDEIARSYVLLNSLLKNLPTTHTVDEKWVRQYHAEVERIERAKSMELKDFRVQSSELKREMTSYAPGRGATYSESLRCERNVLVQKLEALLAYFSLSAQPPKQRIGFTPPEA
jgi:hypothetical protein